MINYPSSSNDGVFEAVQLASDVRLDPVPNYLMWMFVAPRATLPPSDAGPAVLHRHVLDRMRGEHPILRWVLERAEIPATFPVTIRSARPVPPSATRPSSPGPSPPSTGYARMTDAVPRYEAVLRSAGFTAVARSLQTAASVCRVSVLPTEVFA